MTALPNAAERLHALNAAIREAATLGAVEEMMGLIEARRDFLDALSVCVSERPPALVVALDEALRDNNDLLRGLEGAMEQARSRGKLSVQARHRYQQTQTHR